MRAASCGTMSPVMQPRSKTLLWIALGAVLVLGAGGYLLYQNSSLSRHVSQLQSELADTESTRDLLSAQLASSTEELAIASSTIAKLAEDLSMTAEELDGVKDDYRAEKKKNDKFEDQIKEISSTVGDLDKLSKTDEELLEKYSKVYFLNENYIPSDLSAIDDEWKYTDGKDLQLHSKVIPFFDKMEEAAKEDGVNLWVVSAYRSFGTQAGLKQSYLMTYGSGANAFSADQGYSEHQLGTTIDFTTDGMGGGLVTSFESTPAFAWLKENAYKYGFILSYPSGNSYYMYEPWHWRFVGKDLAADLHDKGSYFYDWDQRDINDYLIKIFDR
jgi:D-alanyl-D-alanine carboxypeptidase